MHIDNDEVISDSYFIIMWDCTGLECIIPLDPRKLDDGAEMLSILEDRDNDYGRRIAQLFYILKIRAQVNGQRNYEIYKLTCSGGITEETLQAMFEHNPQNAADLVRSKGVRLYGQPLGKQKHVII